MKKKTKHPGKILKMNMKKSGINSRALSDKLEVEKQVIDKILYENGSIDGEMALRLGHYFRDSGEYWINLQKQYELKVAEESIGSKVAKLPSTGKSENRHSNIGWLEEALQGLAFWIGYNRAFYFGYHLHEGALVASARSLIQANMPSDLILYSEWHYKLLVPEKNEDRLNDTKDNNRADFVICSKPRFKIGRECNISNFVQFVFEVKRGTVDNSHFDKDILRLKCYLSASDNDSRAFLLVISEKHRPSKFVNEGDGKAIMGKQCIEDEVCYKVRRVLKAAHSFEKKRSLLSDSITPPAM